MKVERTDGTSTPACGACAPLTPTHLEPKMQNFANAIGHFTPQLSTFIVWDFRVRPQQDDLQMKSFAKVAIASNPTTGCHKIKVDQFLMEIIIQIYKELLCSCLVDVLHIRQSFINLAICPSSFTWVRVLMSSISKTAHMKESIC